MSGGSRDISTRTSARRNGALSGRRGMRFSRMVGGFGRWAWPTSGRRMTAIVSRVTARSIAACAVRVVHPASRTPRPANEKRPPTHPRREESEAFRCTESNSQPIATVVSLREERKPSGAEHSRFGGFGPRTKIGPPAGITRWKVWFCPLEYSIRFFARPWPKNRPEGDIFASSLAART